MSRILIPFALTILVSPLAAQEASAYKCVDTEGRVTFGDRACPVGPTVAVPLRQAPAVGWDSRGIAEANADLLMEHELRQARQRASVAVAPRRQGYGDALRDRELRMRADAIRAQAGRTGGLASWGLSQQAREVERQRGALWRWPTGR